MLIEKETVDRIEVLPESGHIQVRVKHAVIRDDETEVSHSFSRYVLEKGADLTEQDESIIAIAQVAWGC